jgi:diaminopimelate epimerase
MMATMDTDDPTGAASPETIEFAKGHGTGNDFVIVPDLDGTRDLSPRLVAALCDRRFGVGGDGVLRVVRAAAHPEGRPGAEWFMDYRNADGSVAEMCGNGVRVFARYLAESGLVDGGEFLLATRTGLVPVRVTAAAVTVTLRWPRVSGDSTARLYERGPGGTRALRELSGTVVDCGNPHLVCPLPAGVPLEGLDLSEPPVVDAAVFPAGVNVEFTAAGPVSIDPQVRMRVHERGVGETMSCGSGACAAAVVTLRAAGRDRGAVVVDVPGGRLRVELTDTGCALAGPAVVVARGSVAVERLAAAPPAYR